MLEGKIKSRKICTRSLIILVGYWYLVPNVNRDSYFNPFQSNGLDAEDCLYEVVYPRFSIILCSIRKLSKRFRDFGEKICSASFAETGKLKF